ncbi:MAG: hypothetical protein AAGH15_00370 [Myxococcota bacterium]
MAVTDPDDARGLGARLSALAAWPVAMLFRLLETPLMAVQKLVGIKAMPYVFLLPNLAFFGFFVVIPLFINFAFSLTGGTHRLDRILVREAGPFGVTVSGAFLEARDVVVRDTRAVRGFFGGGAFLSEAQCTLERIVIDGARIEGIGVNDGRLTLRDALIRDLRGAEAGSALPEGAWGRGLVLNGAESDVERVLIEDAGEAGLLVRRFANDGRADVRDVVIRDVAGERSSGLRGRGVSVQGSTELVLTRARIERVHEAGIAVTDAAGFVGRDILITGVSEPPCVARDECREEPPPGVGVGTYDEASMELTRFAVRAAGTCGSQLAGMPSVDLSDGSIADAAVGVCLQTPGFAVERLRGNVVYDVEVAVEMTAFPVPSPILDAF